MTQTADANDTLFEGLEFQLSRDVSLSGRLMEAGSGRYFWHGKLETQVVCACRRCLSPVEVDVAHPLEVLFTEDENADDPAAYVIPQRVMELDPGMAVREELILSVPDYVLCNDSCRGICAGCGADLNKGDCSCEKKPDERWAALEALKSAQNEEGR